MLTVVKKISQRLLFVLKSSLSFLFAFILSLSFLIISFNMVKQLSVDYTFYTDKMVNVPEFKKLLETSKEIFVLTDDLAEQTTYFLVNDSEKVLTIYLNDYLKPSNTNSTNVDEQIYQIIKDKQIIVKKIDKQLNSNVFFSLFGFTLLSSMAYLLLLYLLKEANTELNMNVIYYIATGKKHPKESALESARSNCRLDDIKGMDEIKAQAQQYIDFLQNPQKYRNQGSRAPRGLLLEGGPGVGKTKLARAMANEAGVHFFERSAASFSSKWVGESAAKIRRLFRLARFFDGPAIIFIDEIDAIGAVRSEHTDAASRDDVTTLNTLLNEMDGISNNKSILVIATTNRKEILDPALLRAGRFDSSMFVPSPNQKGREEILDLYLSKISESHTINSQVFAKKTPYFSGAMLETMVNEASLSAVKDNNGVITEQHLEEARLRQILGPVREQNLTEEETHRVAVHELGHAVVSLMKNPWHKVEMVSIKARGSSFGQTYLVPVEEHYLKTEEQLRADIISALAGKVAEELFCGNASSGASQDLEKAAELATAIVRLALNNDNDFISLFSQRETLGDECKAKAASILKSCYQEAKETLLSQRELFLQLTEDLICKKVLFEVDLQQVKKQIESNLKAV